MYDQKSNKGKVPEDALQSLREIFPFSRFWSLFLTENPNLGYIKIKWPSLTQIWNQIEEQVSVAKQKIAIIKY